MNEKELQAKLDVLNKSHNIDKQILLDTYFFERFLYLLSVSKYKNKFIFKGGFLLQNVVGISSRSTLDIDFQITKLDLNVDKITEIIKDICNKSTEEDVKFSFICINPIKEFDEYSGSRVSIVGKLGHYKKTFSIDIATGDVVTPYPITYKYKSIVDDSLDIKLMAYNMETILAEKFETFVSKGLTNSRSKDLYDIYLLMSHKDVNLLLVHSAIVNTFYYRRTKIIKDNIQTFMSDFSKSQVQKDWFTNYVQTHKFASNVTFDMVVEKSNDLFKLIRWKNINLPNKSIDITLIRHGQDEQNKVGGWSSSHITANGEKQVKELSKSLDNEYDFIISSDLNRAKETAELLKSKSKNSVVFNSNLRETNNGNLKDLSKAEFNKKHPKPFFSSLDYEEKYPDGESPKDFYERIEKEFLYIINQYADKKIIIVTHNGVIGIIMCILYNLEWDNHIKITLDYAESYHFNIVSGIFKN